VALAADTSCAPPSPPRILPSASIPFAVFESWVVFPIVRGNINTSESNNAKIIIQITIIFPLIYVDGLYFMNENYEYISIVYQ
jgi:hypothetical protein